MNSFKILLFIAAVIACALAAEPVREKKAVFGVYQDDGSWWPNKYEGLRAVAYSGAYPYAYSGAYPYAYGSYGYPYGLYGARTVVY